MPQSIVQSLRRWDPERIGSYTIIGRLGAGAMGQVFLARSTAGRLVAVKTIRVELAEEPGFRARFAREVAAARRVSGVFTAAVIEADPDADLPWVATAYVPAPSLSTLVKKAGPLPVPAVRWLAAGCAEALQSIHGAGLLHRDVKPSNVLVAPDGPRVIDFGVARASERVQLTSTRGPPGTPAYMAPEQARDATQASPASDVFSLGATLVYAATGHPPYQGETVMDILVRLATEPPDLDGLPDELNATWSAPACSACRATGRPTAAILGGFGSFALSAGAGHVYLPDSAMAVIAEYLVVAEFQHHPRLAAELVVEAALADDRDSAGSGTDASGASVITDVTDGSHTPLPGFESPAALPQAGQRRWPRGQRHKRARGERRDRSASGAGITEVAPPVTATPWPAGQISPAERALLPLWARALIAVLLVASGTAIGTVARDSDPRPRRAALRRAAPWPPAAPPPVPCWPRRRRARRTRPARRRRSASTSPAATATRASSSTAPASSPSRRSRWRSPAWAPRLTRPTTDMQGTFSYVIDQGHQFFQDRSRRVPTMWSPPRPAGRSASASFTVHRRAVARRPPPPGQP